MSDSGAINGLPPHLSEKDVPDEAWYHNWLYSVVPASTSIWRWGGKESVLEYPLAVYLAGFCRNCGKGFTQQIPHESTDGVYLETQLQISKTGCVAPPKG
jgi:hypothetical protein